MELRTELFDYQKAAVEKLIHIKVGALYMEMGTGKTRTALELIQCRMNTGKVNHVLWLCPFSAKTNIRAEIRKHSDLYESCLVDIVGIETLSTSKRENARLLGIAVQKKVFLVVDESNMVKNPFALRTEHITNLASKCPYRLILNGTPVSRNEADMFAQWYILDWRILGYQSYYSFSANHLEYDEKFRGRIRRVLNVDYLTDKIAPYSVQIKKEDCLDLPPKVYDTRYFDMTEEQTMHYMDVLDSYLSCDVIGTDMESVAIYRTLNALQQVCSGRFVEGDARKPTTHCPFFKAPEENPRIQALLDIVWHLEPGEKAVIWCNFQHEIDAVISVLEKRGYTCVEFTGRIPHQKRDEAVQKFTGDTQFFVANKACGKYSLNLQFCHNAIYYNNDWDWATRAQSEDRVHRVGTDERVFITDIVCYSGIDRQVMSCLSRKESMEDSFKRHLEEKNYKEWLIGKREEDFSDICGPKK